MFCAGRPSMFGAMPLLEISPSWCRNGSGPWASKPMRGLIHEVLGNGMRFQDLWGRNQPNCVDHSGRRHYRTHCYGHSSPEDLLEQFIIEDTIRDANHTCEKHNGHQGGKVGTDSNESNSSDAREKEIHQNKQLDVTESLPNDTVVKQAKPWSIIIDMTGCNEVRARIEENNIVVEGQSRSTNGFMTVERVMTLPRHVKGEGLTATFGRNGTLTLKETQASEENQVTDIPLTKEDSCTDQNGILTLKETQASKENQVADIPLTKEHSCTDQNDILTLKEAQASKENKVADIPLTKEDSCTDQNGMLTLKETQASEENQVAEIPLAKENSCTDQSENESIQEHPEQIDTSQINVNESNIPKEQNNDDNSNMEQ